MPYSWKVCQTPGCGGTTKSGAHCAACVGRYKAERAERERERLARLPSPSRRGYDREWQRLAKQILERDPTCVLCHIRPSEHADHIVPIRDAPDRRLDPTNLQGLCARCHGKKTVAEDEAFTRKVWNT